MRRLRQGRTTIVIAHRLTTVAAADQVAVIEDGRVVETGPPEEPLAGTGSGCFADLYGRWLAGGPPDLPTAVKLRRPAEAEVYLRAPGTIVCCRSCSGVGMLLVSMRGIAFVRGLAALGPAQQENGMDDAQIHERIEELVAEGRELWQREAGREPDAAGVRPSKVVRRYEQ